MYGYIVSKNITSNSGEAPSPYFTPILARNSNHSSIFYPLIMPFDKTYMFLIIWIRSYGNFKLSTNTYHNLARFTLSYARLRSTNARHSLFFVCTLCWMRVCKISAYSIVPWWARNPAWVGACSSSCVAWAVKRLFITAINSFANGGVMAILR